MQGTLGIVPQQDSRTCCGVLYSFELHRRMEKCAVPSIFEGTGILPEMCGIAGFTRLNQRAQGGVAHRIAESLYHRGPDQQGIFEGSEVTLCAVRLKIIDLAGGDQPFASEDGDTVIVFNG